MDDADRDHILAQFQSVSGIEDTELCFEILEQQSWNLELALQSFLGSQSPRTVGGTAAGASPPSSSPPPPNRSRRRPVAPSRRPAAAAAQTAPDVDEDDDVVLVREVPAERRQESRRLAGAQAAPVRSGASTRAAGASTRVTGASTRATGASTRAAGSSTRATGVATRATGTSTRATGTSTRAGGPFTRTSGATTRASGVSTRAAEGSTRAPATSEFVASSDPAGRRRQRRLLHFNVDVDDQEQPLTVIIPDSGTVLDVKRQVQQMLDTRVSLADITLDGLGNDDKTVLRDLDLNSGVRLRLRAPPLRPTEFRVSVVRADTQQSKQFHYQPDERLGRLKGEVSEQMGIDMADQTWCGWPADADESTRFADSGLSTDSSLIVLPRRRRQLGLIDAAVDNDAEGCAQTGRALSERLGRPLPGLVVGGLAEALRSAADGNASDRRPLALLLHHEDGRACHALANQAVSEFIDANYLMWCWDLTNEERSIELSVLTDRLLGAEFSNIIRSLPSTRMPCLLILHRSGASYELLGVIDDLDDPSETLTQLLRAYEKFEQWRAEELLAESAREHRTMERLEMESAYEESLRRDKEKEAERLRVEQERQQQEKEQLEQLAKAQRQVPPEPSPGANAVTVRFRLPGRAAHEQRRFEKRHRLRHLAAYCASLGYPESEYNLATSFPRRILSELPDGTTLEEAEFGPQETVLIEEK